MWRPANHQLQLESDLLQGRAPKGAAAGQLSSRGYISGLSVRYGAAGIEDSTLSRYCTAGDQGLGEGLAPGSCDQGSPRGRITWKPSSTLRKYSMPPAKSLLVQPDDNLPYSAVQNATCVNRKRSRRVPCAFDNPKGHAGLNGFRAMLERQRVGAQWLCCPCSIPARTA